MDDGGDILIAARRCGVLPARTIVQRGAAPHVNTYVKCEWTSRPADHPLLRVLVRLQFVQPVNTTPRTFHAAVLAAPRPRSPADVPRWLEAVGCREQADWRVEVEMIPPFHTSGITKRLFLHHLRGALFIQLTYDNI